MTNADKFKSIFGLYATELWAKPEKDFLEWLNDDAVHGKDHVADPNKMVEDLISRQAAIDEITEYGDSDIVYMSVGELKRRLEQLPPAQPEIIRCKDCKYARLTYDESCKYCDIWFPDEAEYMDGNYYCASAERKSNG